MTRGAEDTKPGRGPSSHAPQAGRCWLWPGQIHHPWITTKAGNAEFEASGSFTLLRHVWNKLEALSVNRITSMRAGTHRKKRTTPIISLLRTKRKRRLFDLVIDRL
jgi:hypothetical protein